jgi:RNA polymerase sigma-70 factor (ECF subfamily)
VFDGFDGDFLARFRAGDPEILARVYRDHVRLIEAYLRDRRFAGRVGARPSAAGGPEYADLVQEVFLHAFRPRARLAYDGTRPYANYLFVIARNLVIDLLRETRRRVSTCPLALADSGATTCAPELTDPLADGETRFSVARYLSSLSPSLRQLHDLRYVHELSQGEAANVLGTTRQRLRTMEKRLHDGLRAAMVAG